MAMLAFWMLEISTFIFILFALEYLASGHLFPLDLLPPVIGHALFFTPFPSMLYVPIAIYMGKIAGAAIWFRLLGQLSWLLLAYCLARFAWRRGIRKYAAFGG
jgi:ABC-2 type transport system permease protein